MSAPFLPVTPQANVYTTSGRLLRVPLRPAPQLAPDCGAGCGHQLEPQVIRWFSRQVAANPAFTSQVRSVLLIGRHRPCPQCQQALLRFLRRFRLAGKLRRVTAVGPGRCGCARCRHQG
ncbi:hypothetical protein [Hymenobacter rubripertinctus]|uniref:Uncharacterized protein n=1 Tax=Hymenobacter rubripertinctus TaxID=2029981 RepID=A0A418R0V4_9BACT|nr:hypothetical protein [Hymenobacter rubripertinctus]RIY11009.1 hypothetical protein D0T11_08340 [Hymenobacter rubripertinctus]